MENDFKHAYLAVWKRDKIKGASDDQDIPIGRYFRKDCSRTGSKDGADIEVSCIYPAAETPALHEYDAESGILHIHFPGRSMARLYMIQRK